MVLAMHDSVVHVAMTTDADRWNCLLHVRIFVDWETFAVICCSIFFLVWQCVCVCSAATGLLQKWQKEIRIFLEYINIRDNVGLLPTITGRILSTVLCGVVLLGSLFHFHFHWCLMTTDHRQSNEYSLLQYEMMYIVIQTVQVALCICSVSEIVMMLWCTTHKCFMNAVDIGSCVERFLCMNLLS